MEVWRCTRVSSSGDFSTAFLKVPFKITETFDLEKPKLAFNESHQPTGTHHRSIMDGGCQAANCQRHQESKIVLVISKIS